MSHDKCIAGTAHDIDTFYISHVILVYVLIKLYRVTSMEGISALRQRAKLERHHIDIGATIVACFVRRWVRLRLRRASGRC